MSKCILLLGGARSGKSQLAQELALKSGKPVLFVATAEPGDDEMRRRIEAHRKARPSSWRTLEATIGIGEKIEKHVENAGTVVVDCVTLLVNNLFSGAGEVPDAAALENAVIAEVNGLTDCIDRVDATYIIVSNEVGLGLVPANAIGRLYRDLLGKANQMLARRADEVYLLVAGIPMAVKPGRTP